MRAGEIAERLTAKTWTPAIVDALVGPVERACLAHATDADVREGAASGGAVSSILLSLLAAGEIEGALVCVTSIEQGRVRARYRIATTAEEVLEARGSTYVLGEFVAQALPLIEAFDGRLAVVGLPCEITALSRRTELATKVPFRIALFCGHATTPGLVDRVVDAVTAARPAAGRLTGFRFRQGHWRGVMRATFADGTMVERPFSAYGLYQNLYYFAAKKCLFCGDHFGYEADLCAGDVWTYRLKSDPVKHTALVLKTPAGMRALARAEDSRMCEAKDVPVGEILDGQRRIAPFHHNVSARARAGKRYGLQIPERSGETVRWHERLAARIVLADFMATQTEEGAARVMGCPKSLLKLRLLLLKGLESLS